MNTTNIRNFNIGDAVKTKKPLNFEDSFDYVNPAFEETLRVVGKFLNRRTNEIMYILIRDNPIYGSSEKEVFIDDTVRVKKFLRGVGFNTTIDVCRLALHEHWAYTTASNICPASSKLERYETIDGIFYREVV